METGQRHSAFACSCQVVAANWQRPALVSRRRIGGRPMAALPDQPPITVFGSTLTPGPMVDEIATRWI